MTANESIARELDQARSMLKFFVADFGPGDWLHRPHPKANNAAWTIGHLVLSDRSMLGKLGVTDLPPLPEGFEQRFSRSENAPAADDFGDISSLVPLFDQHRDALIAAVKAAGEKLDQPLDKPHPLFGEKLGHTVGFMNLHVAMHAGQITIIRRSLGRPPLV